MYLPTSGTLVATHHAYPKTCLLAQELSTKQGLMAPKAQPAVSSPPVPAAPQSKVPAPSRRIQAKWKAATAKVLEQIVRPRAGPWLAAMGFLRRAGAVLRAAFQVRVCGWVVWSGTAMGEHWASG